MTFAQDASYTGNHVRKMPSSGPCDHEGRQEQVTLATPDTPSESLYHGCVFVSQHGMLQLIDSCTQLSTCQFCNKLFVRMHTVFFIQRKHLLRLLKDTEGHCESH
ncbi:hypothetical protein EYF80_000668 [Liparis tanakae]|uniref:Uncharacterized protein n=1 Tax=Liparis tanakae TaxID=230148 RepID=A0A4Z2JGU7_9TELE|nr:hypothetical protein EYF80_000668 [Liparis tanakae]